jgi:hypothetical protein
VLQAVLCLIGVAVAAGAFITLHVLPTGHNPLSDAVSDYGVGDYRIGYRVLVVSLGLAAGALAWGLSEFDAVRGSGLVWLVVYAVTRVAIAWYPTDLPGRPRTRTGRIHALLAAAAFAAIAVAASTIPDAMTSDSVWSDHVSLLNTLGTGVMWTAVATAVCYAVRPLRQVFGLAERLLYVVSFGWLAAAAVALINVS